MISVFGLLIHDSKRVDAGQLRYHSACIVGPMRLEGQPFNSYMYLDFVYHNYNLLCRTAVNECYKESYYCITSVSSPKL